MAEMYGVSRITVRLALDALAREGLIRRERGRTGGTFVEPTAAEDAAPSAVGSFNEVVASREFRTIHIDAFESRTCNAEIGDALHLPAGSPVLYIERRIFGARGPIAFVRNFLPPAVGDRLTRAELRRRTLYQVLTRRLRLKIGEVRDEVAAVLADTAVAPRLGVPIGAAVLSIRRLYVAAGDEPVSLTFLTTRSDRYKISVRLDDRAFE